MQFTAYTAVYLFSARVQKIRYPYLQSEEDTVIDLATTKGNKQEKEKKMNVIVIVIANITMDFMSELLICMVY